MPATLLSGYARRFAHGLLLAYALSCVGCAAPTPDKGSTAPVAMAPDAAAPAANSPPAVSAPPGDASAVEPGTGPRRAPRLDPPPSRSPVDPDSVKIDLACSSDADCTVKDVGNCCGHYPACVNVDSPTDPEGVRARCGKNGMASVCGFPVIASCQCVAGRCKGSSRATLD